jgi:hypothetical protein
MNLNLKARTGVFSPSRRLFWVAQQKNSMEALTTKPKESACDRYADKEAKWLAIVQKDQDADGKFYYSVKTTGVYCRPSCPART